jgi:RNA-binding protein YlmH
MNTLLVLKKSNAFFSLKLKKITWTQIKYKKIDFINYKEIGNYP